MCAKCPMEALSDICNLSRQIDSLIRMGARQKAIPVYRRMFDRRSAVAAQRLGLYYLTGVLDGINWNGPRKKARAINLSLARSYLQRAFKWGDRESAYNMAWLTYRELLACDRSDFKNKLKELRKWIRIALKHEHGEQRGLLYFLLATSFNLSGCRKQREYAIKYWKRAARLGDVAAMGELAVAYGWGEGVRKDLRRSLIYFRRVIMNDPFEKKKVIVELEKICADDSNSEDTLQKAAMMYFLRELKGVRRGLERSGSDSPL